MRVLVVEDDRKLGDAIERGLRGEGWTADLAHTGEDAFFRLSSETFDIVILDWMLPGRDGVTILRTLRGRGAQMPVILLTARDSVEDRVLGLDAGADDYLVKPSRSPNLSRGSARCCGADARTRSCVSGARTSTSTS